MLVVYLIFTFFSLCYCAVVTATAAVALKLCNDHFNVKQFWWGSTWCMMYIAYCFWLFGPTYMPQPHRSIGIGIDYRCLFEGKKLFLFFYLYAQNTIKYFTHTHIQRRRRRIQHRTQQRRICNWKWTRKRSNMFAFFWWKRGEKKR